jgi:signal transduction histidine kinase
MSMEERLAEALDQRDAMLRLVAHDIRAPLGVISGAIAEVVHPSVGSLNDEQRMLLTLVKRSCDRLARLATNLSYVSRIQSGQLVANRVELDVATLVRQAVKVFKDGEDTGGATIEVNVPDGVKVKVDREQITLALGNLLSNAVRFARSRIDVRVEPSGPGGTNVHLIVEDDGSGLPPDAGDVFDRLGRKVKSAQSGSGLGLGIVRGVAIANGGEAKVQNIAGDAPGKNSGARFFLVLPTA